MSKKTGKSARTSLRIPINLEHVVRKGLAKHELIVGELLLGRRAGMNHGARSLDTVPTGKRVRFENQITANMFVLQSKGVSENIGYSQSNRTSNGASVEARRAPEAMLRARSMVLPNPVGPASETCQPEAETDSPVTALQSALAAVPVPVAALSGQTFLSGR